VKTDDKAGRPARGTGSVLYFGLCIAGLALIVLTRPARGFGVLDLLLAAVGLLGVLVPLRLAPALILLLLAIDELGPRLLWGGVSWDGVGRDRALRPEDLGLCCGVLAYVGGHFRLLGLISHLLPADRRQGPKSARAAWQRRSPRLVTPAEVVTFVLALPVWCLLAQLCLGWLQRPREVLGFPPSAVRFLLLAWTLGIGGLIVAALFGQWRLRTMTPTEAELLLQDTLWRETRREQRRLQRWLAWSRPRTRKNKETP
jgi:hypothetical protein